MGSQTIKQEPAPEWISVPVAAEMLGCTDVWVLKLIKTGELKGFRLSARAWAVSRTAVEKNLSAYLKKPRGQAGRPRARMN